jgi:hypothetical protein
MYAKGGGNATLSCPEAAREEIGSYYVADYDFCSSQARKALPPIYFYFCESKIGGWNAAKTLRVFLSQRNCLSNFQKATRMFNHHPACAFGLSRRVHNFAELVQIEIEYLVIALPFQVNTQSAWGHVFV